jgi:membrane protein
MRIVGVVARSEFATLVKSTILKCNKDRVPRLGASLAFYTVLSLAPMVVVVLAVAGAVFGRQAAQGQLAWQIQDLVGPQGAMAIQGIIDDARRPVTGVTATILGLIALFLGASAVVNELRDALNTIWQVPSNDQVSGLRSVLHEVRNRVFSFAMVIGVGFFLLVSLAVNAFVAAASAYVNSLLPVPTALLQFLDALFSFAVIAVVFAVLYKLLPNVPIEWSDVAVGALVTSALFTLGKFLIGFYLGRTSVANAYGAAGSLVVVLLWVYYSAQVFFVGAEFTYIYACEYGSRFRRTLQPSPPGAPASPNIIIVESIKSQGGQAHG